MITLRELAHSRTGDKGHVITISLIAYRAEDYPKLLAAATVQRVTNLFQTLIAEPVERYEIPKHSALNFVLRRPTMESVTRSLRIDAHGKTLGSLLLSMEVDHDSGIDGGSHA